VTTFNEFFAKWKDRVCVTTSPELTRDLYFNTKRDSVGFDILPTYIEEQGVDWSVEVAKEFELGSALASRLEGIDLAKFRMIFDRHMVVLSKAKFDEEYHKSSDERALFLIYHRVPPVRIFAAMSGVKNVTFDLLHKNCAEGLNERDLALLSALSTLFLIELNHIMRVYIYFERQAEDPFFSFDVILPGDEAPRADYEPPVTNSQMSYPDKSRYGLMEMF